MDDISHLESLYKKYMNNIGYWAPEGVMDVDLILLQKLGLLKYHGAELKDPSLTRYFQVVETPEKITLINSQFVIWIAPEKVNSVPVTYTLIALNNPGNVHLELVFSASGVYNTSKLVLRVLEMFLREIQETEETLTKLFKAS